MSKTERALDELDTETRDGDASTNGVAHDAETANDAETDTVDDEVLDASDELVIVENGHDPSDELVDLLVDTPPDVDDVEDTGSDDVDAVAVDDTDVDDIAIHDAETDTVDVAETVDTAETAAADHVEARDGDADPVSDDILEELRKADIDGPTVKMAPQDDTTASRRRPKRALDFDPAPMPIPTSPPRILGRKPRVRKVTRVVRHVDPWSVFKIAIIANLVLYVILLTAGVLLWNVANATGTVDNVERFFESFGWDSFEFNGGEIYHSAWIGGLFLVIGFTGLAVLAATLFNLITDLVGGMRFTVLEEEVVETRTSPMRRFVVRRPEPVVPAVVHDDESGPMIREAVVDDESKGLPF
ncbi:MAG: DUF3566 domain-containing protein [Actinomycetota bacterium]